MIWTPAKLMICSKIILKFTGGPKTQLTNSANSANVAIYFGYHKHFKCLKGWNIYQISPVKAWKPGLMISQILKISIFSVYVGDICITPQEVGNPCVLKKPFCIPPDSFLILWPHHQNNGMVSNFEDLTQKMKDFPQVQKTVQLEKPFLETAQLLRLGFGGSFDLNLRPYGPMIVCHGSLLES